MRKFYLKTLLLTCVVIFPIVLEASNVITTQSSFDFGQRERANIVSSLPYQLINLGTDTAFVLYASDVFPFSQGLSSVHLAPGDTLNEAISFYRSAAEDNYNAVLEIFLADDTLSLNVSGSIVDNTPEFTQNEILHWVGTGANRSILVVDFNSGLAGESIAFGYQFDNVATAQDMITAIANAYPDFTANLGGGFLMDLTYNLQSGIGGTPNWWATCSRTESTLWSINWGISTTLDNGDWFGCTYSPVDESWNPTNFPGNPVPAQSPTSIFEPNKPNIRLYPNPATDFISVNLMKTSSTIEIIDMNGKIILSEKNRTNLIEICDLPKGLYIIRISDDTGKYFGKFIKQ